MLLYAISDRTQFAGSEAERQRRVVEQAVYLAQEGVHFFQIREKDLQPAALLALTCGVRDAVKATRTPIQVLLNGPSELAEQARVGWHADGATEQLGTAASASCHTVADVTAWHRRASLLLFAPVFQKTVRGEAVQQGRGLHALQQAVRAASGTPVLALGGVTEANAPQCLAAGAAGVAGIRLFLRPRPEQHSPGRA